MGRKWGLGADDVAPAHLVMLAGAGSMGVALAIEELRGGLGAGLARSPESMLALAAITLGNTAVLGLSTRLVTSAGEPPVLSRTRQSLALARARIGRSFRGTASLMGAPSGGIRAPGSEVASAQVILGPGPGDRLWTHLAQEPVAELPVELVGPIAESAFDLRADLELSTTPPLESGPTAEDYPASPGPDPWSNGGGPVPAADPFSGFLPQDLGGSWIGLEAITGLPPHLRPTASSTSSVPSRDPEGPALSRTNDSSCASCSTTLSDPASWNRCSHCHRPLCVECIVETLKIQGRGWCSTCTAMETTVESFLTA